MVEPGELNYLDPQMLLERHPRGGVTYLFRHAERYPFKSPGDVITANLTENGLQQARAFGEALDGRCQIRQVSASPLARTLDTARLILKGASVSRPIQGFWWLFSPFLREDHSQAAGVRFYTNPGDTPESIYLLDRLEIVLRRLPPSPPPGEINLVIAHDTTVLPVLAYLLGREQVFMQQMPGYLEGIALVRQNGRMALDEPTFYQPEEPTASGKRD